MRNYYLVLGVDEAASREAIHEAYRRLARSLHPDVSGQETTGQFREVQEAWDVLQDARRRREHDEAIRRERRAARRPPPHHAPARPPTDRPRSRSAVVGGPPVHLTLRMTREEARTGGEVPVELPVVGPCTFCGGRGRLAFDPCPWCRGRGREVRPGHFLLRVPPGLWAGAVVRVPLSDPTLVHDLLVLHVEVEG